jgi:hypothetical protein
MLDYLGERLQAAIDSVEATAGRRGLGSVLLGVALAIGVIVFGIAAFIVVFAILVELVP